MMNKTTLCVVSFTVGVAAGILSTWKYMEQKYSQIADEEIASMKSVIKRREQNSVSKEDRDVPNKNQKNIYKNLIKDNGYEEFSERSEEKMTKKEPYVIPPEEFGDNEEYEKISLTLYSDGVLTDESDEIIDDVDGVVGSDSLTHFGEYEDDSVFVRNDERKCDYEILLDQRTYTDALWEV